MKKIIAITLLTLTLLKVNAQDIIVKNDKTEIKAKIEELTETSIKYKKIEMLDGPSYNINKRDVFMIIYKNGTKEYIESQANTQPSVQNNAPVSSPTLQNGSKSNNIKTSIVTGGHEELKFIKKGLYSFEGEELTSYKDYFAVYEKYGYNDLSQKLKDGRTTGVVVSGVSLAFLIGGVLTNGNLRYALMGAAIGGLLGGKNIIPHAINSSIKAFNTRANKNIGLNSKLEIKPLFASDNIGNHVGISIGF